MQWLLLFSLVRDFTSSCSSLTKLNREISLDDVEHFPLGSNLESIVSHFGQPDNNLAEVLNGQVFEGLEYNQKNGTKIRFILDPSNILLEKVFSSETSVENGEVKFEELKSRSPFRRVPVKCHWYLHAGGSYFYDEINFIFVQKNKAENGFQLFFWSNKALFHKRLARMTNPCPKKF